MPCFHYSWNEFVIIWMSSKEIIFWKWTGEFGRMDLDFEVSVTENSMPQEILEVATKATYDTRHVPKVRAVWS